MVLLRKLGWVVSFAVFVSGAAHAGVEIKGSDKTPSARRTDGGAVTISIEGDQFRMDRKAGKDNLTVLFNGKKRVMTIVNHGDKSYMELTPEQVKAMKQKLSGAMAMMEKQLKSMPPQQRAQMEKMLKGKGFPTGGKAPKEKIEFVSLMRQSKTGKWMTDHYEARRGRDRIATYWVASWSNLGIDKKEFGVMETMQKFSQEMLDGLPQGSVPNAGLAAINVNMKGFPVKVVNYENRTRVISETEFSSIEKKSIAASNFDVPAGYTKRELPKG